MVVAALTIASAALAPARVDAQSLFGEPHFESWTGVDATMRYGALWTGLMAAPLGPIDRDGLRVRAVVGAGRYAYQGTLVTASRRVPVRFIGGTRFHEALAGYHMQVSSFTLKPFIGFATQERQRAALDPERGQGKPQSSTGLKLAVETWLEIRPALWASVDASWTQAEFGYWARARTGYRLFGDLSLGAEASVRGQEGYLEQRAGLLARYAWSKGEVSLVGGPARSDPDGPAPRLKLFTTANVLMRF